MEMRNNPQAPNGYNENSTPTRGTGQRDKVVSRRAVLIGLLVLTLVALGAVCAVVALMFTQQARLEESVKDLAAQLETLKSTQQPQNEAESVQLLRVQGDLLQNVSTQLSSFQILSTQIASLQDLSTQMASLLEQTGTHEELPPNSTNQDPIDLTLVEHMREIMARGSFLSSFASRYAVDKNATTLWFPGPDAWTYWIKVDFVTTYTVRQVDLMLACNALSQPSSYRVTLSDGSTQEVSKPCPPTCPRPSGVQFADSDQALYTLELEPRRTSSLRLQPTVRCNGTTLFHYIYELVIWGV